MKQWGWRTRSIFDGSKITDETDPATAVARRFGSGKQAANIEPHTIGPDCVTSGRTSS
jgi:hypothetical protein